MDLTHDYQVDYMRAAIDSFNQNGDGALAQSRYNALGEDGDAVYTPIPEGAEGGGLGAWLPWLCVLGVLLLAGAAAVYFFFFRGSDAEVEPEYEPEEEVVVVQPEQPVAVTEVEDAVVPPTAKFLASYKFGDELYDDSFSIDSSAGEFLGECGVGVSETVGVGDTQKVTAFEVWLFDKNDIQTETKVLMSSYAYSDNEVRSRLAAKGEPVIVSPGSSIVLETQALYMIAKVIDMGYGDGAMPQESYFDRFVLELAVWPKTG
jgi:hypothetical protein